jgi:hypothetical protein
MAWQDEPMFDAHGIKLGALGAKWIVLMVDGEELAMPVAKLEPFKAYLREYIARFPQKEAA